MMADAALGLGLELLDLSILVNQNLADQFLHSSLPLF